MRRFSFLSSYLYVKAGALGVGVDGLSASKQFTVFFILSDFEWSCRQIKWDVAAIGDATRFLGLIYN
jgi:hypothetical protein